MLRSLWPFPVLVFMVLILGGHDVLMAADPHTSGAHHSVGHDASSQALAVVCMAPDGVPAASSDVPMPGICRIVILGAMTVPGHREISWVSWGEPPDHPPDVRRAFLQVFLN